jgi:hypothetical protein
MISELQMYSLPEVSIFDENGELFDLEIVGLDAGARRLPQAETQARQASSTSAAYEDRFLSKIAAVCASSDQETLVDNLVRQSFGAVGFGPMVSALREYRA